MAAFTGPSTYPSDYDKASFIIYFFMWEYETHEAFSRYWSGLPVLKIYGVLIVNLNLSLTGPLDETFNG
jgi:hypothetical protein